MPRVRAAGLSQGTDFLVQDVPMAVGSTKVHTAVAQLAILKSRQR